MKLRRSMGRLAVLLLAGVVFLPACDRRKPADINPITPSFSVNRTRAPLGSAIEVTYTWTLDPGAKKLTDDYRALVHFLDSHKVVLFTDDHVPQPAPSSWEPGKSYSYTRTVFIPVYPYVGEVTVAMGLYPAKGRGERVALKGEDVGLRAFKVGKMDFLANTENIFPVYKEGWHNPESHPENPSIERTWTKKDALVSFKNPRKDVIVYLEADTCLKCFKEQPVLRLATGNNMGVTVPIESAEVFLKKVRFKAADLGDGEWVDLRFSMNQSFVPAQLTPPMNTDDRELGLLVYHLFVGEADKLGNVGAATIVDAAPLPPEPAKAAGKTPAGKPGAKPTPAPKATPAAPKK